MINTANGMNSLVFIPCDVKKGLFQNKTVPFLRYQDLGRNRLYECFRFFCFHNRGLISST